MSVIAGLNFFVNDLEKWGGKYICQKYFKNLFYEKTIVDSIDDKHDSYAFGV